MKQGQSVSLLVGFSIFSFFVCSGMGARTVVHALGKEKPLNVALSHKDYYLANIVLDAMIDKHNMIIVDDSVLDDILVSKDGTLIRTGFLGHRSAHTIRKFLNSNAVDDLINERDQQDQTLLHIVLKELAEKPDSETLRAATCLLRRGINKSLRDNWGKLALFYEKKLAEKVRLKSITLDDTDSAEWKYLKEHVAPRSPVFPKSRSVVLLGKVVLSNSSKSITEKIIRLLSRPSAVSEPLRPLLLVSAVASRTRALAEALAVKGGSGVRFFVPDLASFDNGVIQSIPTLKKLIPSAEERVKGVVFLGDISTLKPAVAKELLSYLVINESPYPPGVLLVGMVPHVSRLLPEMQGYFGHILDLDAVLDLENEKVSFEDVFVREDVEQQAKDVIDKLKNQPISRRFSPLLISGPERSGKKRLVKALAHESGRSLFMSVSNPLTFHQGAIKTVAAFDAMVAYVRREIKKSQTNSILFLGRVDALSEEVSQTFLSYLEPTNPRIPHGMLVVAEARTGNLNPGVNRCFLPIIKIIGPDSRVQEKLLSRSLDQYAQINFDDNFYVPFADGTEGCSSSQLIDALYTILAMIVKDKAVDIITPVHIIAACQKMFSDNNFTVEDKEKRLGKLRKGLNRPSFRTLKGMPEIIKQLENFVSNVKHKPGALLLKASSLIFYGPPGTGKTSVAEAVGYALGWAFYKIGAQEFEKPNLGEGNQAVQDFFNTKAYRSAPPCVIFIDEIDMLCSRSRSGQHPATTKILGALWQKISEIFDDEEIDCVIILATNYLGDVDKTLRRRFQEETLITIPDATGRVDILKHYFQKVENCAKGTLEDQFLKDLGKKTENFSPSALKMLVQAAGKNATERRGNDAYIEPDDVLIELPKRSEDAREAYDDWNTRNEEDKKNKK